MLSFFQEKNYTNKIISQQFLQLATQMQCWNKQQQPLSITCWHSNGNSTRDVKTTAHLSATAYNDTYIC